MRERARLPMIKADVRKTLFTIGLPTPLPW
jgi:hypothetical protein